MPRPRFSYRLIADTFTIEGGQTVYVPVDLVDSFYPQIMIKADYATTGNPAGLSCVIYPGFMVDAAGDVEYCDNGVTVAEMQDPVISTGTPQTKRSGFGINPEIFPRHIQLKLTNRDASNPVTVRIVGDW